MAPQETGRGRMIRRPWVPDAAIAVALFILSVLTNLPLFMSGESPYRDSIALGYAGMARFITNHPSPWGWNPFVYCGLATQFMYLPGLSYLTAVTSWITRGDPVYLYKIISATLACLTPSTVFLFVRHLSGSRLWAFAAGVAIVFFSPLYGLIRQIDTDRGIAQIPWRLHVLTKYGEGPHNASLMLLPLAWLATLQAARSSSFLWIFVCAVAYALVVLMNWVGALALGFTCLMFLVAAWRSNESQPLRLTRPLLAAGLAYLLACFWITPSFVQTIAFNWPADAYNYKLQRQQWILIGTLAGLLTSVKLLALWLGWRLYETFVILCAAGFGFAVLTFYSYGTDVVPEARRYALEFELFLALALFALLKYCFEQRNEVRIFCGILVLAAATGAAMPQVKRMAAQGWTGRRPLPWGSTAEYKIAEKLASLNPTGRVLATGGLRFRMNAYRDLQQVGGSFESGLRNRTPVDFAYHIRTGEDSKPEQEMAETLLEMKALGVEYVVVHGPKSDEHYRDYKNPGKFEGVLERAGSSGAQDDIIYRVPFKTIAHAVRPEEIPTWANRAALLPYGAAIDDPARPQLIAKWQGVNDLTMSGAVPEGMRVVVQVSHDPGWSATQDGAPIAIEPNDLGYMTLLTKASAQSTIALHYGGTIEQRFFFLVSAIAWGFSLAALWRRFRRVQARPVS